MTTHSFSGHKTEILLIDLQTAIHYPLALPLQVCYEKLGYNRTDFPASFGMKERVLSLPMYAELNYIYHKPSNKNYQHDPSPEI